jgi:hypothetical protein
MQRINEVGPAEHRAQFVIAVFDDWDALHGALVSVAAHAPLSTEVVLLARSDVPPHALASGLLKETTHLHFAQSRQHITCTIGQLANELSTKVATGAQSIAEALHAWLGSDQAEQLESHIEKGRLVLWVEVRTSEDYSIVCGMLVQASSHMVGLCKIGFEM